MNTAEATPARHAHGRMTMLPTRIPVSMGRAAPSELARPVKAWVIPMLVGALVVFGLIARIATIEASVALAVVSGFVTLLMIVMGLAGLMWRRPKTVSVARNPGRLVFAPPAVLSAALSMAAGLAMASLARLWAEPEQWAYLSFQVRGAIVVAASIGAFMIVEPLWSLRRPAGLTLDERGVRGVRGGPRFDLTWPDVTEVKVAESKKQRFLALEAAYGVARIPEGAISGDVYAVATVVKYYLEHPEERSRLVDGLAAVRHVDAEVRARRFSSQ